MNFDDAFTILVGTEGGYSNRNPQDDPGGETMWGVTLYTARSHGYTGAMKDLPQSTAKAIYRLSFWLAAGCDQVPADVAFDLFDTAVNSGPSEAVKLLQASVGTDQDGAIGPHTLAAVAAMPADRLRRRFNGHRLALMTDLNNWSPNSKGWARRVAANLLRD
jgi:lysozyme family protein